MGNSDNKDNEYEIRDEELNMRDTEINEDDYEEEEESSKDSKAEVTARDEKKEEKKDVNPNGNEGEYEDVCFICRRPESKAGKMFKLPNNICVCSDCMHKTMETVSQFDYQGMLNNPQLQNELDQMTKQGGFPNISFVNLADLRGDGGIPNKQKIKKKTGCESSAADKVNAAG